MGNLFLQPNDFESVLALARESIRLLRDIAQEQEPDGGPFTDEVEQIASEYDAQKDAYYPRHFQLERKNNDFWDDWDELNTRAEDLITQGITRTKELLESQE